MTRIARAGALLALALLTALALAGPATTDPGRTAVREAEVDGGVFVALEPAL